MKRLIGLALLAGASLLSLAPDVVAQNKTAPKDGKTVDASPQFYAMLRGYREIVGVVQSASDRSIVIKVSYDHPLVTAVQNKNNNNRNRNNRNKNGANRPQMPQVKVQILHDFVKFDLPYAENPHFRTLAGGGGVAYDSKGEPKLPETGPFGAKLPGNPATINDVSAGDAVKLMLSAPLASSGNIAPRVHTVVILRDGSPATMKKKN